MNRQLLTALAAVPLWAMDERRFQATLLAALRAETPAQRRGQRLVTVSNGAAILPIDGVLVPKPTFWGEHFGGETDADTIRAMLRQALGDDQVRSIVLLFDSPGGNVEGTPELADELFAARGQKPIVAHCRYLAASGAYYLASQADAVWAEPSAEAGSIGVFAVHQSFAKWLEEEGIEATLIRAGTFKAEFNPYEPLTDDAKAHLQAAVDQAYDGFVKAVARGRGVTPADVRSGFGEGRCLSAKDAKAAGIIDRIGTLDELLARQAGGARRGLRAEEATAVDVARDRDILSL